MADEIEYDCSDCGRHVIAYGFYGKAEPGKRCSSCDWIHAHIAADEQAEVRDRLENAAQ